MIEVKGASKQFGTVTAVRDLTFRVEEGEVYGLLGENGAGKTTTMRMMATILTPTAGDIEISGFSVREQPLEVRRRIGILFGGEVGLYSRLTARENIAYFGNLYGLTSSRVQERIDNLSRMLDMEAFIDRRVGAFSRGMKQKVAIARTLVHDPDVILLDEPTTGLDVTAATIFRRMVTRLQEEGKTILFSSHNMGEISKLCKRIALMHKGKLRFSGDLAALRKQYGTDDLDDIFMAVVEGGEL
ncbi:MULTISPECIES: ATP-binding cassette domain-containing protein [Brevibacillus]|uniref:ABC transporter ATP-binding protein n=1 Tax=Brevibacillus TaxID=55080 RepID=UPI000EC26452|nr:MULTISPECIES: ATP-binding cassette domain-containing protein [Brevibacillus]MBU8715256.1 ATP-binding cassette domain-containing protein [Brevibacillus parabrevis]MDR4999813.1 ATP-binding cassette domain-containing protein [Brevibacillus parabrevis]MED2257143.1 ATP-binding cassette domain-containing protein [Brevibacillus parabrevis]UED69802.1 ATP-binding cassette domain-containing protein [Brevibacillus sp. HD3.3A]WDV96083.1 ATP-binding cassette domain-containing protein [Brevibacillus para